MFRCWAVALYLASCHGSEVPAAGDAAPARSASPPPTVVSRPAPSGAAESAPLPRRQVEQLYTLVGEMLDGKASGPMLLYAHAFTGYALVNVGLSVQNELGSVRVRLDQLVDRVMRPQLAAAFRAGSVTVVGRRLSASVALRGHLALLLVGLRGLGPLSPERERLIRALVAGIADDLLAARHHLLSSYGSRVWPADNEVAAAALELYLTFVERDARVSAGLGALQGSLRSLERTALPPSAVAADRLVGTDLPRGCALSWTVAMRGLYDPPSARALYSRYRRDFFVQLGPVRGFREWPAGVNRPADADSGPIISGVGTAASGIGIGAARLADELTDHHALIESAELMGLPKVEAARNARWLERALAIWARTARPWK